jgi:RimJ/RimL family protein N-acetyltransferase
MKSAIPIVLDIMKRRLTVKEVYAMVLPSNRASIHLLELNDFSVDKVESKNMAIDQHTGEEPLCYKKTL